jgi:hypothetical protein
LQVQTFTNYLNSRFGFVKSLRPNLARFYNNRNRVDFGIDCVSGHRPTVQCSIDNLADPAISVPLAMLISVGHHLTPQLSAKLNENGD